MSDDLRTLLQEHPEWLRVLAAYAVQEPEAVASPPQPATAEATGEEDEAETTARGGHWFPRINQVDGVPEERLAPLHGRLIAHGLLQFNLGGRDTGVRYRVTGEAKRVAIEFLESAERQTEGSESSSDTSSPNADSRAA